MNSFPKQPIELVESSEDSIDFNYSKGVYYYQEFIYLIDNMPSESGDVTDWESEKKSYRKLAINYLKKSLQHVGDIKQQLMKISAALLLVKLHNNSSLIVDKEYYFYNAVNTARKHLGDRFQDTHYGKEIRDIYLSDINPEIQKIFHIPDLGSFSPMIDLIILSESDKRLRERREQTKNIKEHLKSVHSDVGILEMLENILGPVRLFIMMENSGEIISKHRFSESEVRELQKSPENAQHITVRVFDKPKKYVFIIDYGDRGDFSGFDEYQWENIIYPIVECYIRKKEYLFFLYAIDSVTTLEFIEETGRVPLKKNDYQHFLTRVIEENLHEANLQESEEIVDYIDDFLKALDICRNITIFYQKQKESDREDFFQEINILLGGEVNRKVLNMVQSMLLSRNETMNGTGFPFGLDRTNIPLEGKLYSVIRAYETLCCMQNPKHVLDVMQEWCDSCYFDENIFRSFRDSTKKGVFTKIQSSQRIPPRAVSYHRMNRYRSFVTSWYKILDIMRNIEANYQQGRLSSDDAQMKNITFKRANELRLQLLQVADIRKLIVITRHGETESDTEGGPPGDDDEFLTEQGEMTSLMKGEAFEGLNFRLFASPLIRSQQTAAIICQKVNSCTRDIILNDTTNGFSLTCASCPFITLEETIANPKKNREDDRYNSYAHKLFADDNMKGLIEFLTKLAFSSKESVNLFIAHRDSARNLIFWLRNLFEQNGISGEKTPIGNDTIYEFLFRGDHLVRGRENRTKGLIFSVANWKPLLSEINTIVMSVFGEIFYTPDKGSVNLIALHDVLLDFLDRKIEECPEDFDVFLERILARDITKDLFEILKRERIIQ